MSALYTLEPRAAAGGEGQGKRSSEILQLRRIHEGLYQLERNTEPDSCAGPARMDTAGAPLRGPLVIRGGYRRRRTLGAVGREGTGGVKFRYHLRDAGECRITLDSVRSRIARKVASGKQGHTSAPRFGVQ